MTISERDARSLSPAGFHKIHVTVHGRPEARRAVLCLHGVTRNGRDFDLLAAELARDGSIRVICPDLVGRGRSDRLADPAFYHLGQYLTDMVVVLAALGVETVDVVGTSLGGVVGMMLAAQPGTPVRRLIVNDAGPALDRNGLDRIAAFASKPVVFDDLGALAAWLRYVLPGYGPITEEGWRRLASVSARRLPDGRLVHAHDPAIGNGFRRSLTDDIDLWSVWDAVTCPTLILRGERSDVLSADTAATMAARARAARVVTVPGVGHAPALMDERQIRLVRDFLNEA